MDGDGIHPTSFTSEPCRTIQNFNLIRILGVGAFGEVWLATTEFRRDGSVTSSEELVAIKRIRIEQFEKYLEVEILKQIDHPNCIRLMSTFYSYNSKGLGHLNIVFEYAGMNNLSYLIEGSRRNVLPTGRIVNIFKQIFRALDYLHERRIAHRDLKPSNIMVDEEDRVKIIDFGHAKRIPEMPENHFFSTCYCVSRNYRAPELIFGNPRYGMKIDIWSIGCILAETILGSVLFPGENNEDQMFRIVSILGEPTKEDLEVLIPSGLPSMEKSSAIIEGISFEKVLPESHRAFADLLSNMLAYNPEKRWSAKQILKHPVFSCEE